MNALSDGMNLMYKTTIKAITGSALISVFAVFVFFGVSMEGRAEKEPVKEDVKLEAALKNLKLPGVKINVKERCVDVDSVICLKEGVLEFVACTKNSKEHESLIAIEALPKHVHTALLLIGAKAGSPATRKPVNEEKTRWISVPPSGGQVDVFLVIDDGEGKVVERPISDFLEKADEFEEAQDKKKTVDENGKKFPTQTFLFAGSRLHGKGDTPRTYLADVSGSVISLATFGDELLCLPGINAHTTGALMWQVNPKNTPPIGTKMMLRLRPKL